MNKLLENKYIKKYQLYLIPAGGLLITAILLIFFIIPQISSLSTVNNNIEQINQQNLQLSKKIDDLKKVDLDETKKQYQQSLVALPTDKNIPSAVAQLQRLSSQNNLQLSSISLSGGVQSSNTDSFSIKAEVTGDLGSINNFLDDIKDGPRIMKVSSIEIVGATEGNFTANVGIMAYYQPQQNTLGNIEDPVVLISETEKGLLENIKNLTQENFDDQSATVIKGRADPFE